MCGRFTLKTPAKQLASLFDDLAESFDIPQQESRHNICPTQDVLAVRKHDGNHEAAMLRWGLVPFWAKELKIGNRMINARSETVFEKPAFRNAVKSKRCAIVTDGFYEWKPVEGQKKKQPWLIARKDRAPWLMAGLWESWRDPEAPADAPRIESCTIITTAANDFVGELHDRMPVKLESDQLPYWLDCEFADKSQLKEFLEPREWEGFEITKATL
jgi:putative SOS response-associated peptidase YedK